MAEKRSSRSSRIKLRYGQYILRYRVPIAETAPKLPKLSDNDLKQVTGPAVLFFEDRPDANAIHQLSASQAGIHVSHPSITVRGEPGWAELVLDGLTFDLSNLKSAKNQAASSSHLNIQKGFGIDPAEAHRLPCISLTAGPHLQAGQGLIPVVRGTMRILLALCRLDSVKAVGWLPAHSVMSIEYFDKAVGNWLSGGSFPALGLVSLFEQTDGSLKSCGLAFILGQEIEIAATTAENNPGSAQLAIHAIDFLVKNGPVTCELEIPDPDGMPLHLLVDPHGTVQILRRDCAAAGTQKA